MELIFVQLRLNERPVLLCTHEQALLSKSDRRANCLERIVAISQVRIALRILSKTMAAKCLKGRRMNWLVPRLVREFQTHLSSRIVTPPV
jgi:hypothetical protein